MLSHSIIVKWSINVGLIGCLSVLVVSNSMEIILVLHNFALLNLPRLPLILGVILNQIDSVEHPLSFLPALEVRTLGT